MLVIPLRNLSLEYEFCAGTGTGQELKTPRTKASAWATYAKGTYDRIMYVCMYVCIKIALPAPVYVMNKRNCRILPVRLADYPFVRYINVCMYVCIAYKLAHSSFEGMTSSINL